VNRDHTTAPACQRIAIPTAVCARPHSCAPRARLTDRQREYTRSIGDFHARHGHGPSLRDLAAALGVRSTNAVNDVLRALRRKGVVTWEPKTARSLRLTGAVS
jgi:SOS-response transcriptional repressor LexA